MSTVNTEKIDAAIEYMKNSFTEPLIKTGEDILQDYNNIATDGSLESAEITPLLQEQQDRINTFKADLESIFNKARGNIEDSNAEIKSDQAAINNEMEG